MRDRFGRLIAARSVKSARTHSLYGFLGCRWTTVRFSCRFLEAAAMSEQQARRLVNDVAPLCVDIMGCVSKRPIKSV
jgi:hypothetical protein